MIYVASNERGPTDDTSSRENLASRPFVLATFFDGVPEDGGGYVHKSGLLHVLKRMEAPDLQVMVICDSERALATARDAGLRGVIKRRTRWNRVLGTLSGMPTVKRFAACAVGARLSAIDRLLTRLEADLVFFPGPDSRALQLYTHRYIFSIWDLAHLEHPEFPEVSDYGQFELREYVYGGGARGAIAVIADSLPACGLIAEHYRIPSSRIHAAPFLMSPSMRRFKRDAQQSVLVRDKYSLKEPYIFYPAQFWPHKNHRYILAALRIMLHRYQWAPQAVFCGSDKGALRPTMKLAQDLGVGQLVNYCGFVPDADMPYLYSNALALVMPTYFGPSNLPPVEALSLGIPVCYADFPSFREVMGDAVKYVDLADPGSLASAIEAIRIEKARPAPHWRPVTEDPIDAAAGRYLAVLRKIVAAYRQKMGLLPVRATLDPELGH